MAPLFLSLDEVLEIHEQQIERYGGSPGIRDTAGLHLGQNHAVVDGNKRVGANAAITFLLMNDWEPIFDEDELADLVLAVASGAVKKPNLIRIFEAGSRPIGDS